MVCRFKKWIYLIRLHPRPALQPQHTVPDLFVWLLSNNKRVAYARVRTRDLLFSSNREARGILCGKILTLFLKVSEEIPAPPPPLRRGRSFFWMCVCVQPPGKRTIGLTVQAKLDVFLWFGSCSDSAHMLDDLPAGFRPASAEESGLPSYLASTGEGKQTVAFSHSINSNEFFFFRETRVPAEVSHVPGPRPDRRRQHGSVGPFCPGHLPLQQSNHQRKVLLLLCKKLRVRPPVKTWFCFSSDHQPDPQPHVEPVFADDEPAGGRRPAAHQGGASAGRRGGLRRRCSGEAACLSVPAASQTALTPPPLCRGRPSISGPPWRFRRSSCPRNRTLLPRCSTALCTAAACQEETCWLLSSCCRSVKKTRCSNKHKRWKQK